MQPVFLLISHSSKESLKGKFHAIAKASTNIRSKSRSKAESSLYSEITSSKPNTPVYTPK